MNSAKRSSPNDLNVISADDLEDAAQKIVGRGEPRGEENHRLESLPSSITKIPSAICQGFTGKIGTFHSEQAIATARIS